MDVEILITGTEVTNGTIVDTNSSWLAKRIHQLGLVVRRKTTVGDRMDDLLDALRASTRRARAVVMSGGLGPTTDDLTREAVAKAARVPLRFLPEELRRLEQRYRARGVEMPASNRVQAYIPRGARKIPNATGTAPGFESKLHGTPVFALPGVPSELKRMFDDSVAPRLAAIAGRRGLRTSREILVLLLSEAVVGERADRAVAGFAGLEVGYLIGRGGVIVRLSAGNSDRALLRRAVRRVLREFGELALPVGSQSLEEVVVARLIETGTTLALAESCTGGMVAEMLTRVPGVSAVLLEGVVAYANRAKVKRLGVREATLRAHGAVSRETALEMARGIVKTSGARMGIAVTGIAGPSGGTPEKPVGLVYVAGKRGKKEVVEELRLGGDRPIIRLRAAAYALLVARRLLQGAQA